jgi:hypothetical protein
VFTRSASQENASFRTSGFPSDPTCTRMSRLRPATTPSSGLSRLEIIASRSAAFAASMLRVATCSRGCASIARIAATVSLFGPIPKCPQLPRMPAGPQPAPGQDTGTSGAGKDSSKMAIGQSTSPALYRRCSTAAKASSSHSKQRAVPLKRSGFAGRARRRAAVGAKATPPRATADNGQPVVIT